MNATSIALTAILLAGCSASSTEPFSDLANAARAGDVAAIRQLAVRGADPNLAAGRNSWTPLLHAIHKHQNASVAALLDAGADINRGAGDEDVTPLMMAAGYGYDDTVQLLLHRGANPALTDRGGETALDWALAGTADIDEFTFFRCQDSTVRLLHAAAPGVKPTALARRAARMKRCQSATLVSS